MEDSAVRSCALLLEDDPLWQQILSRYLGSSGYEVKVVSRSSEARRLILSERFDLIVLDLKLPDEGGPHVLETIETLGLETRQHTVVLTGYPRVAESWARSVRVIDKADIDALGHWIRERRAVDIRSEEPETPCAR